MDQALPPYLMTSDPNSFARSTIVDRKPTIIKQVIEDNPFPKDIIDALIMFKDEIAHYALKPLAENVQDTSFWNKQCQAYRDRSWLELPWYFAEAFFYRRLLEATQYFQDGKWNNIDPFLANKKRSLDADLPWFENEWQLFNKISPDDQFSALFYSSLWGNRADLSNFTVREKVRTGQETIQERHLVLIDHTEEVKKYITNGLRRIDYITDNIGKELLFDLATIDYVLENRWCGQIVLHLKDRPFFVSDATIPDAFLSIQLQQNSQNDTVRRLGKRLSDAVQKGKIMLKDDPFYTSCLMYRDLPEHVRKDLTKADLVILKGDVNYRRLLDDRHWPYTSHMEDITAYFPTSFIVLRTLKGEIMVDLEEGQADILEKEDRNWLIDGKRGVIKFVKR